jgi:hypothetical protein
MNVSQKVVTKVVKKQVGVAHVILFAHALETKLCHAFITNSPILH